MKHHSIVLCGAALLLGGLVAVPLLDRADTNATPAVTKAEPQTRRCAVCGMFVDRHAAWLASIRFNDGQVAWFDGPKDLFKYYLDMSRYDARRSTNQIESLQVTDYYTLKAVDGYRSQYVAGSDVLGPMGHELVPFATQETAREFLRDHHGKRILGFGQITSEVLRQLAGNRQGGGM